MQQYHLKSLANTMERIKVRILSNKSDNPLDMNTSIDLLKLY